MRSIACHSVRLARSASRARQSSSTRFQAQNVRNFHQSIHYSSEPRAPTGPQDHHSPFEHIQDEQKDREEGVAELEKAQNHNDSQQSSTDARKTNRKTLRQRRNAPDIPNPPPIPDWFLNHNVLLHLDELRPDLSSADAQALRCVDESTGHTLFTIPYYRKIAGLPGLPDQKIRQHNDHADQRSNVAASESVSTSVEGTRNGQEQQTDLKFRHNVPNALADAKTFAAVGPDIRILTPQEEPGSTSVYSLLRWILLEIDASARAAFTVSADAQRASLFAASNVDISILCPDSQAHARVDEFVGDLATLTGADLIRLDANDFADLTADYVGHGLDSPGWFSTLAYDVFDGYASSRFARPTEDEEDDDLDEEDEDNESHVQGTGIDLGNPANLGELRKALYERRHELAKALGGLQGVAIGMVSGSPPTGRIPNTPQPVFRQPAPAKTQDWDESRLSALLDHILDAPCFKRSQIPESNHSECQPRMQSVRSNLLEHAGAMPDSKLDDRDFSIQEALRIIRAHSGIWFPEAAALIASHLAQARNSHQKTAPVRLELVGENSTPDEPFSQSRRTIVHVRDLSDICRTQLGSSIIRRLLRVIQKRRRAGEEVLFIGTSAQDAAGPLADAQQELGDLSVRHLILPPFFHVPGSDAGNVTIPPILDSLAKQGYHRCLEINLRHIQRMLNQLRPTDPIDLFSESSSLHLTLPGVRILSQIVLPLEHVHRIVLTAIGLSEKHTKSEKVSALHVALATLITSRVDQAVQAWCSYNEKLLSKKAAGESKETKTDEKRNAENTQSRMDRLKKNCNPHELRLFTGVVDPDRIKTGFNEVHAPQETIATLKTLTSLSLLRPDAFQYGVLASDRLTGLMLYGPPGTGKTLLARAVAKEARATVLEISGAQIYEKYVGEGEKMVRAVFSLAKKLSPCIVFLDEADALFSTRSSASNRTTHREILTQFLREWDGMEANNVFIMVASNRPFDFDDAILRRLPRRLLVDLPVAADRESILAIHLKDEQLDDSVSLASLAAQTPLYSGSDLKNVCVAAALACVREENETFTASLTGKDAQPQFPAKRTLSARHFEQAIREISASISEDMSSLAAIRKFDEKFGDRRGRRRKPEYGFGVNAPEQGIDEDAARVRQVTPPASISPLPPLSPSQPLPSSPSAPPSP